MSRRSPRTRLPAEPSPGWCLAGRRATARALIGLAMVTSAVERFFSAFDVRQLGPFGMT